jgi:hypothetical protein
MTKRRQKYNKRTRKRIRQTKITRGQTKRISKKQSRARGPDWLNKILGKPLTLDLDVLMQKFTNCKQETDCNSIKSKIIEQLTEMKKNEIAEIKKR